MLENAKQHDYENLISWMPDRKSFKIHVGNTNEKAMFVKLLKQYFNHNKYGRFSHQLRLYKFERIHKGPQRGVCKHVLFMEGRPDLFHRKSIQDFQQQINTTTTIISMGLNNLVQPADDDDDDGAGGSILISPPPPSMAAVTTPGTNTRNGLASASRSSSTNANLEFPSFVSPTHPITRRSTTCTRDVQEEQLGVNESSDDEHGDRIFDYEESAGIRTGNNNGSVRTADTNNNTNNNNNNNNTNDDAAAAVCIARAVRKVQWTDQEDSIVIDASHHQPQYAQHPVMLFSGGNDATAVTTTAHSAKGKKTNNKKKVTAGMLAAVGAAPQRSTTPIKKKQSSKTTTIGIAVAGSKLENDNKWKSIRTECMSFFNKSKKARKAKNAATTKSNPTTTLAGSNNSYNDDDEILLKQKFGQDVFRGISGM
jgi:hypothetical protein